MSYDAGHWSVSLCSYVILICVMGKIFHLALTGMFRVCFQKVQVGNDQEKVQSEISTQKTEV